MNWGIIFGKTILERGRQYYNAGKVKNLTYENGCYHAIVRGRLPYRVDVDISGNTIRSLNCTCAYAADGHHCKHMAAVLIAIERQKAQEKLRERLGMGLDPEENQIVVPFPKEKNPDSEYSYFDMSRLTERLIFTKGVCDRAKKMIADKKITLQSVNIGYSGILAEGKNMGTAKGTVMIESASYPVSLEFDQKSIREASCQVPGCQRLYVKNYFEMDRTLREGQTHLCVHETALLFLLAGYVKKYRPGDATDFGGARLMRRFRKTHRIGSGAEEAEKKKEACITLTPRLEETRGGFRVSFRIGTEKKYVLKDLQDLVENVQDRKTMELGTRCTLDFATQSFTEESRCFYDFIEKAVREEQGREAVWRDTGKDGMMADELRGSIPLYGARLDELYEMIGDRQVEYQDSLHRGFYPKEICAREKMPDFHLNIVKDVEDDVFQGVCVSGKLPQVREGVRYYYYAEPGYWNRVAREKIEDLRPFYEEDQEGSICFRVGRKHLAEFYYSVLPVLRKYGTVREEDREEIESYLPPEASFAFYLDAEDRNVTCLVQARYGDQFVSVMDHIKNGAGAVREVFRDTNREIAVVSEVLSFFPQVDSERELFHCGSDENLIYEVLEHGIGHLLTMGEVHTTDHFRHLNIRRRTKISIGVSVDSDIMNLEISSDDISQEELLEILASYRRKKKFHRLKNGDFLNMEEESLELLSQLMEDLHLTPKEFVKGKMQLPAYRALYLDQMLSESADLYSTRDSRFKKMVKEFKTVKDSEFETPESLRRIMRKYQTVGYRWLRTLDTYGFGGILADDMGLGKTLQMISVLLAHKLEGGEGTSLIIAPASLVFNWQEEFRRYAPELSVCLIVGTQAERLAKLQEYQKYDVLVTSYDLLKRDIAEYEDCRFAYQVLDEAQYIKNHSTAASKAVKIVHSRTRFALTGTPIENRLSELWSIFDYLMPGFLYGYDTFKKDLETPITKNKDEAATARLKKMVSPFILRRLKQNVLKDLPDKLEEIRFARLESEQQKLYDAQVLRMRDMLKLESEENYRKNKLEILAELTKVRQICCDPSLFLEDYHGGSAKREACLELIRSAMEGEHKMLVFSQFTSMLELLEEDLQREKIPYYKITGATPKETRVELVRQFNEDTTPVFLISLKAGGTGLNLTGADVVIHYDPWWNLAVQNQATDRAHRLGQTRVVSVYKLIVKDSIEEKILMMQEAKKNLADEILSGETGGIAGLTKDELLALIQGQVRNGSDSEIRNG